MKMRTAVLFGGFCLIFGVFLARLPVTIAHINTLRGVSGPVDWDAAFSDVLGIIRERYVDQPNEEELLRGAIRGMTDALNDPYTEFIPPADQAAFEKDLTGQFVGIGATVNARDGWLNIAYPLEDSPAYRAGLLPGDQVRAIDGKSTKDLPVEDAVKILVGEPGTPVTLTIAREGREEPFEVVIRRAPIAARAVKGFRYDALKENWDYAIDPATGIAYIRVDQFTPNVADEFHDALTAAGQDAKGLIIDLRDNPGGLMQQAVEIVDMFLDSGTIVSTKGRSGRGDTLTAEDGSVGDLPVAILVNHGSASASEIVAGALADNGRATVIGTRTFGKGLVQRVEPLQHVPGAQLKITEQHYYLPSGRLIQRTDKSSTWGVDPADGFYVPLDDAQQRTVITVKREMETIRPPVVGADGKRRPAPPIAIQRELAEKVNGPEAKWGDPKWVEETLGDPQLAAALRAMQIRLAEGAWKPVGKPAPELQPRSIASAELLRLERERSRVDRYLQRLDERVAALASGEAPAEPRVTDLWDNAIDVTGGKLDVFDKDGKLIATLDITGPDVERWLVDADIKPRRKLPPDVAATVPGGEAPTSKPEKP